MQCVSASERSQRCSNAKCNFFFKVDFIESIIQEYVDCEFIKDPIERALVWSESNNRCVGSMESSTKRVRSESVMHVGHWTPTFKYFASSVVKPVPSEEKSPISERNPLPSTLKYAFLGKNESYPMVISSGLTED